MRVYLPFIVLCMSLQGCGSAPLAPVTYSQKVSVHSVLPVHIRVGSTNIPDDAPESPHARFDAHYQHHFTESLKVELVRHGVFGSISDAGSDDVFRIGMQFLRVADFPGSRSYGLTVDLETDYRSERKVYRYHVLYIDDESAATGTGSSAANNRQAAAELMSLVMADLQQAVADRKLKLNTHVKDQRTDISRMLVKW